MRVVILFSPKPMKVTHIGFANGRGDKLAGTLHEPARQVGGGAVILCHGMESNRRSEKLIFLAEQLARRGMHALRFDFRYVGESSGKFADITYSGEVEDLRAAFELMGVHYAMAWRAAEIVQTQGLVLKDKFGQLHKHPALQILRDNSALFKAYAAEFGMTPSARSRIEVPIPHELDQLEMELFGETAQVLK